MTVPENLAQWRKSTYSTNNDCVEVRMVSPTVDVRDTKDQGKGPELSVRAEAWSAFVDGLK